MKHTRVIFVIATAIIALAVATLISFRAWDKHEIIGTVEGLQPPICTQNTTYPTCGDGVLTIKTEDGAVKEYKYASDKSESGEFNITSLQKGAKIKLVVSQGKITNIELTE